MESQRSFLLIGLALVSFLLWQQWQLDYAPQPVEPASQRSESSPSSTTSAQRADVPSADPSGPSPQAAAKGQLVFVKTDTLDIRIDTHGGDVISAALPQFPVEQGGDESLVLLSSEPGIFHIAQSGLIGQDGPDGAASGRPMYRVEATEYEMSGDTLTVPLVWQSEQGLKVTKTFNFTRGEHHIRVDYHVENQGSEVAQLQQYAQLKQTTMGEEGSMFMPTYRGAAYSTEDDRYTKYSFDDIADKNLRTSTPGGWVGMLQHYFVAAWVPPQEQQNTLYSRLLPGGYASIGFTGTPVSVAAGETVTLSSTLYTGAKDQEKLAELANGLDLTVDYGFLFWLSQPLFSLLKFIHGLVANWGLAIVIITVLVKGLMYPLTKAQYESMAKLRALQPKMKALKDRYGDDRQKMSQAMMEMYKKEKVNPMGGCFPLLLQMPIFLALYWVLLESVELRHADFFLWITDLSVKDPYFVLPILTGASMYLIQKLQPMTIQDPMQQKIMQFMPVMMSIFFLWFPAGLVLYWLISNVITLVQAKLIYASMEKRGLKTK
ncbi:membrane protein insertase YidC [Lacimicrobium alkaliphilum]|uniref:Membrane protein insertase YidC n=1 Tax=Lacimicrobium alkaliphilum TaxID=1526571 RepID=A0ABQ1RLG0_9ALTE|nr:membrane protein insertase YidC [Lacimicrobium alkaliphilum]GGD71854.1 membrane protein insertase YidC [Lacimicrobium alkaliphilum]